MCGGGGRQRWADGAHSSDRFVETTLSIRDWPMVCLHGRSAGLSAAVLEMVMNESGECKQCLRR